MTIRPRRSVLYMPGSNARALEKAKTLPADGVILDLEDAVAPDAKATARDQVVAAVKAGGFGAREVFIRINGLDTPWFADDLTAAAAAAPDAILIPKISTAEQLELIAQRLLSMHTHQQRAHLGDDRDADRDLQRAPDRGGRDAMPKRGSPASCSAPTISPRRRARASCPAAPRCCRGSPPACSPRASTASTSSTASTTTSPTRKASRHECAQARDLGFDGKTLIHPNQIEPCNAAFSPAPDEVAQARKMIAAFDLPENKDKGVVQIDGRMVERMHAEMARRTVAIADAIAARG